MDDALLEKLLRSCPGIDTIYLLLRPKRGLTVFDRVRARWPERLSKLSPIAGDVSAPGVGVSVDQKELLARVTVLFHSAATVRFTEPLHTAAALNALVHVSTAYSNAPQQNIEERVYPPPYDPESLVRCAKMLPPQTDTLLADSLQVSRGTYRSGFCRERCVVDLVPVDLVVNCCILAAWRQGSGKAARCPVYNVTSGSISPLQWGAFSRLFVNMMKLARRFKMAAATGEYFANNEWTFGVQQLTALHKDACAASDGVVFPHWPDIDWEEYIGTYMLGIRKYVLKDGADSLTQARTKLNRLYWVHKLVLAATGYYFFRLLAGRLR
ncbi:hypothetical protein MSG28_015330 [Choristoneura fumiferana]|uniref:Uncharacterized protein n=1 Tax=Choristoneura fumiferana TaxID=7141 RepID=A0ACC0K9Z3_CHOFU|nr:hypothetical protein MSG28_015330 [Choristoneura fumiferana]